LISFSVPALSWFYSYGWFTGAFTGALVYFLLNNMQTQTSKQAEAV